MHMLCLFCTTVNNFIIDIISTQVVNFRLSFSVQQSLPGKMEHQKTLLKVLVDNMYSILQLPEPSPLLCVLETLFF